MEIDTEDVVMIKGKDKKRVSGTLAQKIGRNVLTERSRDMKCSNQHSKRVLRRTNQIVVPSRASM